MAVGGFIAAYIIAFSMPNIYTAHAKLVLASGESKLFEAVPETANSTMRQESIETELQIINSRLLAGRVVNRLDLTNDPFFNPQLGKEDAAAEVTLIDRVKNWMAGGEVAEEEGPPPTKSEIREIVISNFASKLRAVRSGMSFAVNIEAVHTDPQFAATLANTTAEEYLQLSTEDRRESTKKAIQFLQERAQTLAGDLSELEQKIVNLKVQNRLDDTEYPIAVRAEITQLKTRKDLMSEGTGAESTDSESYRQKIAEIDEALSQKQLDLAVFNRAQITLAQLERELQSGQDRYIQVVNRLGNLDLQAESLNEAGTVISRAQVPGAPTSPKRKIIVISGVLGGLTLALLYILLREGLNTRIRSESDLARMTALPVLGEIPEVRAPWWKPQHSPHEYLKVKPSSQYANVIRQLAFACKTYGPDHSAHVILITSCLPDEGKTSTALSISHLSADDECRTVLLDLDMHKAGVHRAIGVTGSRSFDEVISGKCSLEEATYKSPENPMLDVISFSRFPEEGENVLDRKAFGTLIEELTKKYDLVVIDTPPVLLTGTASMLARFVSLALVIVRWGDTNSETLASGLKKLQQFGNIPISLAISRVNYDKQAKLGYDNVARYRNNYAGRYSRN